jgi:hypothetical protein
MKRINIGSVVVVVAFLVGVVACAQQPAQSQEPVVNVSPQRHPNIAAAQELSRQAYDKLTQAQEANEFDMGGHAARARQLLQEANEEMKLAALAANRR